LIVQTAGSGPNLDDVTPRLRFAPAPTGFLHIGSARTALFNWLYARHVGGELILRIEDTNAELASPELVDNIYRSLEWLGIDWDGDPVRQSARGALYQDAVEQLLGSGQAYIDEGAVRFRVPETGTTEWHDLIRGTVTFENENIEDFVIRRSDGSATFFVANAVDDLDLGITHVVRGEDLVNVTPKVILLRHALGDANIPDFAHLPLIVNEQRKKLSKRRDDVALEDYRARGFLPEAMVNYLALLGWGPSDDVEVRPIQEIVSLFELGDINKSSAMFDIKKLTAINGDYIRLLDHDDLANRLMPYFETKAWFKGKGQDQVREIVPLVRERAKVLEDAPGIVDFLFLDEVTIEPDCYAKAIATNVAAVPMLDGAIEVFAEVEWTAEALHGATLILAQSNNLRLGKAQAPIRVAVTGRTVGPPLFEALELLGRDETLRRLRAVID